MEKKLITKSVFFSFAFVIFFLPTLAEAASLGFSPSTLTRSLNDNFTVTVSLSSNDVAMNAASGVISFDKDKLEIVSLSKTNSIMSLWVQEPSFSNQNGTVNFEGVVLNPGFQGAQGNLLTITFRAKASGQANVRFTSGTILANDGVGTNILSGLGSANFLITGGTTPAASVPATAVPPEGNGPAITSTTHPDQSKWYANSAPEFVWVLPEDALEVRTVISASSGATPSISYIPPITSKTVEPLTDGVYYFALQIRTASGWSDVGRYRINIDTKPPEPFSITFPHSNRGFEPQPVIMFNTTDKGSGVSGYEVVIDGKGPAKVAPAADSNPYPLPPQVPGDYTVTVTASDEAGNSRSASESFTIEAIEAPRITYYQEEIVYGDILKIRGTTYPDSEVHIFIREGNEMVSEEYTKSSNTGDFVVVATKRLNSGDYTFTARVTDSRGAMSNETSPLTLKVKSRFLNDIVDLTLSYLSAALLAIVSLALIFGGGGYVWYRSFMLVRRLRRESSEAETVLQKSFEHLRQNIAEHAARLRTLKRKLTKEEIAFLEQFENNLNEAEKVIVKEIQDIGRPRKAKKAKKAKNKRV